MTQRKSLEELVTAETDTNSLKDIQLIQQIKIALWETYDPNDDLIYPTVNNWDDLLAETIENTSYSSLTKDEVLSILFGLDHRNRIVEGLWWSMFECGVTRKLLQQLLALDTDKH